MAWKGFFRKLSELNSAFSTTKKVCNLAASNKSLFKNFAQEKPE